MITFKPHQPRAIRLARQHRQVVMSAFKRSTGHWKIVRMHNNPTDPKWLDRWKPDLYDTWNEIHRNNPESASSYMNFVHNNPRAGRTRSAVRTIVPGRTYCD